MVAELFEILETLTAIIIVVTFIQCLLKPGDSLVKQNTKRKLQVDPNASLVIEVYYEAMDDPSDELITDQLIPTYEKFKDFTEVIMIPFGKTHIYENANNTYEIRCDPNPLQCEANLQHACLADNIKQTPKMFEMLKCLMINYKNMTPTEGLEKCAQMQSIGEMDNINNCTNGDRGMRLLKINQDMTSEASNGLYQEPFTVVYGDKLELKKLQTNLFENICKMGDSKSKWKVICQESKT